MLPASPILLWPGQNAEACLMDSRHHSELPPFKCSQNHKTGKVANWQVRKSSQQWAIRFLRHFRARPQENLLLEWENCGHLSSTHTNLKLLLEFNWFDEVEAGRATRKARENNSCSFDRFGSLSRENCHLQKAAHREWAEEKLLSCSLEARHYTHT